MAFEYFLSQWKEKVKTFWENSIKEMKIEFDENWKIEKLGETKKSF